MTDLEINIHPNDQKIKEMTIRIEKMIEGVKQYDVQNTYTVIINNNWNINHAYTFAYIIFYWVVLFMFDLSEIFTLTMLGLMSSVRIITIIFKLKTEENITYNRIIILILILRFAGIIVMIIPNKTTVMYLFIIHSTSV